MVGSSLVIDVREACRANRTGKGQWTYGFVCELLRRKIAVQLLSDCEVLPEWTKAGAEEVIISGKGFRWHWNVLQWLRRHPGVTYMSPTSYIVPAFAPRTVRCIPVIHDLIAFRNEPHDRKATLIERWTLPRVLRKCSRLCTVSESTKHDLLARYPSLEPSRVLPIFAGPLHPHPQKPHPDAKTILCVATLCPRKNQLRLIRAFASLPDDLRRSHQLILAGGRGWHDDEIVRIARETPGVEWRGYITGAQYESLLSTCAVFALPSLYEGFGMQILDALQRGIPVLTSDRGSLKELAEGAAMIADPECVECISRALDDLLRDTSLRSTLAEKGRQRAALYSWRRTVDLFLSSIPALR
ncbi:MAG: glycosyltransferase family 4 protein [Candidatus Peribacteraceae bacterium]|nr:glycosyltransferase family 4 protein [Candidatus Peribacteraceae bacterium]